MYYYIKFQDLYFGWLLIGSAGSPTKTRLSRFPLSLHYSAKTPFLLHNWLRQTFQSLPHQKLQNKPNNPAKITRQFQTPGDGQ